MTSLQHLRADLLANLRELRTNQGITLNELAKRMRAQPERISFFAEGNEIPTADQLRAMTSILRAPPDLVSYLADRRNFLAAIYWRLVSKSQGPAIVLAELLTYYRQLRFQAVEEAAGQLDFSAVTLGTYENAILAPDQRDLEKMLELYRIPEAESNLARALLDELQRSQLAAASISPQAEEAGKSEGTPSADIFLSYRRSDESAFASRLYDKLEAHFGHHRVFMDIDSIEMGVDFVEELGRALSRCTVFLAIIGRKWVTSIDAFGERRLYNPEDVVRMEIEEALRRDIRLIPILVDETQMPSKVDLPVSLVQLPNRNGYRMSNARFESDCVELLRTLDIILAD